MTYLQKGMKVKAQWFETELKSLSGVQMKTGATMKTTEGVIVSIRGDRPTAPTSIRITLDNGNVIEPGWITEVIENED